MKDAKMVKKEEKGFKAFLIKKKGWAIFTAAFIIFLLFSFAMPMVNIPVISRIGNVLGLAPDEMGGLTLADLAAYSMGIRGNGITAAQNKKFSSYETVGGISPFSVVSKNMIADAEGDYLRQYQASIGYQPGSGGVAGAVKFPGWSYGGFTDVALQKEQSPVIDENRAQNKALGNPVFGSFGQGPDTSLSQEMAKMNLQKPLGGQNIDSKAAKEGRLGKVFELLSGKFFGGRSGVMGGYNALVDRINVRLNGMGQMGALGSMGRTYYYSYNARIAGYKVTAKSLAEAAFDGSQPADQALIVPGEKEEAILNTLQPASTVINKANARIDVCAAAKKAYQAQIEANRQAFKTSFASLQNIGSSFKKGVPGCCAKTLFLGAGTSAKRAAWNAMVDSLVTTCGNLKQNESSYTTQCGFSYNGSPKSDCSALKKIKLKGGCSPLVQWKCTNKVKFSDFSCSSKTDCKNKIQQLLSDVSESAITGTKGSF